jgi:hypothetical protein
LFNGFSMPMQRTRVAASTVRRRPPRRIRIRESITCSPPPRYPCTRSPVTFKLFSIH